MEEAVIVSGARTPIGRFGGAFQEVSAAELGSIVIRAALERAGIQGSLVDDVIFGCSGQIGDDTHMARRSAIGAGIPIEVPAYNVNRICGSGLQAINSAVQAVRSGEAQIVVAGGTENMSQLPYFLPRARWGYRMGDATFIDALMPILGCPFNHYHMGITAENVAERFLVSREDQDRLALESHRRAIAAIDAGRFKEEIVPVRVPQPRGEAKLVDTDEHPRRDTSLERLAALPPAFKKDGTVTAGNSSGINDGAGAVVVTAASKAREMGIRPRLRVLAQAVAGVDPAIMGIGPVPAVRKLLAKAGLGLDAIELIELNEAFASQAIAVGRELGLDWGHTNVNGGAVALGHPVGATTCILTIKLMHEMERRGARLGIVTACIGGGQGIAGLFENVT